MSKYLNDLIRIAKIDLPSLQYDFNNASTLYSLQAACQRLFNITNYLLYHAIDSATCPSSNGVVQVARVTPVAPVEPVAPVVVDLPAPPFIAQPIAAPTPAVNASGAAVQPGITNVMITSNGTQVISPTGVSTILPPGEAVDLATSTGRPVPPPAPPGVDQVILPPGGGMTPDVLAALSSRPSD